VASFYADVRAVFTDLDGTLTTGGRILPSTYQALAALAVANVSVVVVTGRPAGWGDALLRLWPVAAVVAENGGAIFLPDRKVLAVRRGLPALRRRMAAAAAAAARRVPGARLARDTPYTEVNMALDWNEDVHLDVAAARRLEAFLRGRGFRAVRSSVHVNFWPPGFDKLTACRAVARELFGGDDLRPYIYVGDALNDEPLFAGFPRSVGVANVRAVWEELGAHPARVTRRAEGRGFEEVAAAVLGQRAKRAATRPPRSAARAATSPAMKSSTARMRATLRRSR